MLHKPLHFLIMDIFVDLLKVYFVLLGSRLGRASLRSYGATLLHVCFRYNNCRWSTNAFRTHWTADLWNFALELVLECSW